MADVPPPPYLLLELTAVGLLLLQAGAELLPLRVELSQLLLHPRLHPQSSPPLILQLLPQKLTSLLLLRRKRFVHFP